MIIERQAEELCILIQDDGHGIQDSDAAKVFDAFFTTRLERNASGLGLTIAQRIVRGVEGTLTLTRPQDPTSFELTLKLSGLESGDA